MDFRNKIFNPMHEADFTAVSLDIFHYQYSENEVYRSYCDALDIDPGNITYCSQIPFLPVSFFKTHTVISGNARPERIFLSSGTSTRSVTAVPEPTETAVSERVEGPRSRHLVTDLSLYDKSLVRGFEEFYGPLESFVIFALTPDPKQNPDSSLIYMISKWISESGSEVSGFYLDRQEILAERLLECARTGVRAVLIGLSYALMDFAESFPMDLSAFIVMETGGMKGKREEMVREEMHAFLSEHFHCHEIHSEYGMTELLSQAYSTGEGRFRTPPWMNVLIRDVNDPLSILRNGLTGGISIIDLANYNSCSFLAIQDLGKIHPDGTFEVLGRFDFSDLRGCNLLMD
jgi:acyl-CoA synthetase (AMP-forming)/AMP-acid ligase II